MLDENTVSQQAGSGLIGFLRKLHSIEFGPKKEGDPTKIKPAALADLLRLLLMLLENGLTLPKALASLAADRSTKKYVPRVDSFANGDRGWRFAQSCDGTISAHLLADADSTDPDWRTKWRAWRKPSHASASRWNARLLLRKRIINKTSYPILITVAGTGLMVFMCVVVVPEFETVYASSNVELPMVTRVVTGASRMLLSWGWLTIPAAIVAAIAWISARAQPKVSRTDRFLAFAFAADRSLDARCRGVAILRSDLVDGRMWLQTGRCSEGRI